jgi:hypothetical protein
MSFGIAEKPTVSSRRGRDKVGLISISETTYEYKYKYKEKGI